MSMRFRSQITNATIVSPTSQDKVKTGAYIVENGWSGHLIFCWQILQRKTAFLPNVIITNVASAFVCLFFVLFFYIQTTRINASEVAVSTHGKTWLEQLPSWVTTDILC